MQLAASMSKRDVLIVIGTHAQPVTALGIQAATGLAPSTVQNTLRSLMKQRLAARSHDGVRFWYSPTPRGIARLEYWDRVEEQQEGG